MCKGVDWQEMGEIQGVEREGWQVYRVGLNRVVCSGACGFSKQWDWGSNSGNGSWGTERLVKQAAKNRQGANVYDKSTGLQEQVVWCVLRHTIYLTTTWQGLDFCAFLKFRGCWWGMVICIYGSSVWDANLHTPPTHLPAQRERESEIDIETLKQTEQKHTQHANHSCQNRQTHSPPYKFHSQEFGTSWRTSQQPMDDHCMIEPFDYSCWFYYWLNGHQ